MVREVIWTKRAQKDRISIFSYWDKRNMSQTYSLRLNKLFKSATSIIAKSPKIGRITTRENIRIKFISHFAMIYKVEQQQIQVLSIFDTRQSPDKLDIIVE